MRLLWQSFVDQKQNAAYFERLHAHLSKLAAPGTQIELKGMSPPDRDFGRLTEFRCGIHVVENALAAEQNAYDGFVLGHFQDPGLYEARSALHIPIVGTGETTLHFAAQLGRRIGLVSIDPVFEVWHLEQAERYGLRDRIAGVAGLGSVPADFAAAFAGVDALIGPTAPDTAFKLGEKADDPLSMYLADVMTVTVNLAGLPALSLPAGFDAQGLPIGVQLIGPALSEARLYRVAASLEAALGVADRRPAL